MHDPLNESQRELLSAFLDGEVTDAEKQVAVELLKREDARNYLDSLRATAALVTNNAPVRAPVGLSGRVMNSLKNDFKQSVDPGSEPFTAIPRISWQAPIWAAAAVVIVSVAIMFAPGLFNSKPESSSIARDVLDNLPTGAPVVDGEPSDQGPVSEFGRELELEKLSESERELGENLHSAASPEHAAADEVTNDASEPAVNSRARRAGAPKGAGDDDLRKESAEERGKNAGEKKEDSKTEGGEWDGVGTGGGGRAKAGKGDKDKDHTGGETPPPAVPSPPANRDGGDDQADDPNTDSSRRELDRAADEEEEDQQPRRNQAPKGDAAPGDQAPEQQPSTIELSLTEGATLAAQTDVLWISKLYGDARLDDADNEVESVEVEVDADKLPELMAALRKLAVDQGYGSVEGGATHDALKAPADDAREPEESADSAGAAHRISGYLPTDDASGREDQALKSESSGKVRVVIRLN
ncbi:MAG: hypothetical protein K8I27_07230 [Planctomycetes bacterium]|nr:hypothetical protein [Planctomycetota bacterium]